jgi:hypothetical protein
MVNATYGNKPMTQKSDPAFTLAQSPAMIGKGFLVLTVQEVR